MVFARSALFALAACSALSGLAPAQVLEEPGKRSIPAVGIKTSTRFDFTHMKSYRGVVEEVKGDRVTVMCHDGDLKLKSRTFTATDLLAEGGFHEKALSASHTYLWADLKKGDSVSLETILDQEDKVTYCVEIKIERRPGGKLPQGQKPEEERWFLPRSLQNDIDNGEDVSDEDIAKAFPLRPSKELGVPDKPGGLDKEYQKKLDAIRAKKKDLKAAPPEKKDDKK
jgi:hypothetical protein